jgi:hypothetical protein
MRKSAEIAQNLIDLYSEVLGTMPNMRYVLFASASDQMTPPWIDAERERAKRCGDTSLVVKINKVDESREEFLVLILDLFRTTLELSNSEEGASRLCALDASLVDGVQQMKNVGVVPKPFILPKDNHREESLSVEDQIRYFLNPHSLPLALQEKQIRHLEVCVHCRVAQERFKHEPRAELEAYVK